MMDDWKFGIGGVLIFFSFSSSSVPPNKLCGIDLDGIYWVC
jgi:hypothetical protein